MCSIHDYFILTQAARYIHAVRVAGTESTLQSAPRAFVCDTVSHTEDFAAFADYGSELIAAAWTCRHSIEATRVDDGLISVRKRSICVIIDRKCPVESDTCVLRNFASTGVAPVASIFDQIVETGVLTTAMYDCKVLVDRTVILPWVYFLKTDSGGRSEFHFI